MKSSTNCCFTSIFNHSSGCPSSRKVAGSSSCCKAGLPPHRRRRFCVLITRFLRTSSGCGRRAPAMRSVLSPIIAAIRALKSSVVSTRSRFIASPSCYRMDRMRCCGYLLASFGAGQATIFSKRGSPRSGFQAGGIFQGAVTQRERTDRRTPSSFQLLQS